MSYETLLTSPHIVRFHQTCSKVTTDISEMLRSIYVVSLHLYIIYARDIPMKHVDLPVPRTRTEPDGRAALWWHLTPGTALTPRGTYAKRGSAARNRHRNPHRAD